MLLRFKMVKIKNMVMIGATARNSGKTTLAEALIKHYSNKYDVVALKISGIHEGNEETSFAEGYELTEEHEKHGVKDTSKLLNAGARRVFRMRNDKSGLIKGFNEFLSYLSGHELIVCESNSLRNYIEPGIFIMMKNPAAQIKPSAEAVLEYADVVFEEKVSVILDKAINMVNEKVTHDNV